MVGGGFLGTPGGFVQLIITGGANPHVLSTELTLSLLVMVRPAGIRAHQLVDSRHSSPTTATFIRAGEVDPRHLGGAGGWHGGTLSHVPG